MVYSLFYMFTNTTLNRLGFGMLTIYYMVISLAVILLRFSVDSSSHDSVLVIRPNIVRLSAVVVEAWVSFVSTEYRTKVRFVISLSEGKAKFL